MKQIGTMIDGIAASEHLDSSGERLSIRGLDISSLPIDGLLNYEHKSDTPAQIVGKILKAKKIFSEEDCETERELHFWTKSNAPFVYIIGELFDKVGHSGAQEVAALLRYDSQARESGKPGKNIVNFSIEGSKLNKDGQEITRSLARKVTVTALPCNKQAIAEEYQPVSKPNQKQLQIPDFAKSESGVEILEKDAKILKFPSLASTPKPTAAKKVPYPFSSHEEHAAWKVKNQKIDVENRQKNAGLSQAKMKPTAAPAVDGPATLAGPNKTFNPSMSGKVDYKGIKKATTAGSSMGAPSTLTGGSALSSQEMSKDMEKLPEFGKFLKFITDKYPDMTKDESSAMAKYLTLRALIKAEESMENLAEMDKSKNVREQKKKIFGTDANAPRLSDKRQKMMQRISQYAEKKFGLPMVTAEGKRDASGKMREDKQNQPAFDVFTPKGVEKERKLLEQYKKKGIKRVDPKPDWRSGRLETQPSPDAAIHEVAHLNLAPEGLTSSVFQEHMDKLWGESQSKYGHMQQKKTSGEIQPMSVENSVRREIGLPANRTTKPVKQNEPILDAPGQRFVEGKDSKGNKAFYDRQTRLQSPATKERVQEVREGSLKFHPDTGWYKDDSPDTLVNLRGRGKADEAKARAQQKFAQAAPKKMAASEDEKGVHSEYGIRQGRSKAGHDAEKGSENPITDWIKTKDSIQSHKKVLKEIRSMPKPNLPKSEEMDKAISSKEKEDRKIAVSKEMRARGLPKYKTNPDGKSFGPDNENAGHKYGINEPWKDNKSSGTSLMGQKVRNPGEWYSSAKADAKDKVQHLKEAKKPNLPKSEEMNKAKEERSMDPSIKRKFREERASFSSDPLKNEMTSEKGVSDSGIEVRRADSRKKGILSHGYGRTKSPAAHVERAKDNLKETLTSLRSQPKANLPKSEAFAKSEAKPKYVNVEQHWTKGIMNNKTKKYENPITDSGKRTLTHVDDLHKLKSTGHISGWTQHDAPKKEFGHETYELHPDGKLKHHSSHYDTSD